MTSMSHSACIIMKCPSSFEEARSPRKNMEKSPAAASAAVAVAVEFNVPQPKTSPLKEHLRVKPQFSPVCVTRALFSLNNNTTTTADHNKENDNGKAHDRCSEVFLGSGGFEDSGYMSLQNSHIDDCRDDHAEQNEFEEQSVASPPSRPTCQEKQTATTRSPLKTDPKTTFAHSQSLGTFAPPKKFQGKTASEHIVSSTPAAQLGNPNLPILRFQRAVYEELAKSFQRTQRYDWSVVSKLADDYPLDRMIGRQMGREYVDVFASLLSRNMQGILTRILAQLGDLDLISCKRVSRVWRRIISEDQAALCRCQQAEQRLLELGHTPSPGQSGLTRDVTLSRVVMSCMQTLASSTPCSRTSRRVPSSQRDGTHTMPTRFQEYLQAASSLKRHESLCRCTRCGYPAKNLPAARRATCTRSSCLFDFCTCCLEDFHGSCSCRVAQPRTRHHSSKSTVLIGSARSKKNVRRL